MTTNKDAFNNNLNELMNKFYSEVEALCKNYSISCINALNGKMGATTQKHAKLQAQIALQEQQIQANAKILEEKEKELLIQEKKHELLEKQHELLMKEITFREAQELLIQEKTQREKQAIQDNLQKTKTLKKLTTKKLESSNAKGIGFDHIILDDFLDKQHEKITDGSDTTKTSKTIESKPTIQNHDIKHRVIETTKKKPCNIYKSKKETTTANIQEVNVLDMALQDNKTSLKKARRANRLKSI